MISVKKDKLEELTSSEECNQNYYFSLVLEAKSVYEEVREELSVPVLN